MKKSLTLTLMMTVLTMMACVPSANEPPTSLPIPGTQISSPVSATEAKPSATRKTYTNDTFGLSFQYPSTWFGPSEYGSGETLRVEVGSDTVYPYGERPDHPSSVKDSYNVVLQYTKNNQNSYWKDTYQSLLNLKDGESLSGARNMLTRVRQLHIGRFAGFEYITTLSETAQTDYFYTRSILLVDGQTNDLLTIIGQPNNVEINNGAAWRDGYRTIDEANLASFQEIVESMTIK